MRNLLCLLAALALAGCAPNTQTTATRTATLPPEDAAFTRLSEDYLKGYLAWRPATGTSLGYHQYDGKISDFSAASLVQELARLKQFEKRLAAIDPQRLSVRARYDYRILSQSIKREIFSFETQRIYVNNPMTYAGAIDVNIYIKRNFAPLEQRVRSIISILNQAPNVMAAGRANLAETLPGPFVETAIEMAGGSVDFLAKDLVAALQTVTNKALMAEFTVANQRAQDETTKFKEFLKTQKLPKATDAFALGRTNYAALVADGEMVSLPPEELLEVGLRELHRLQTAFAEAGNEIAPGKPPKGTFQAVQKDHPTEQSLIPDAAKDLDMIRRFITDHHLIAIPSTVRPIVAETPQYLRAMSFASMDIPGPFETKATEAYYYITPPEASWPAAQKDEWLTAFNYYTTDIVSIHEAYPGHYVNFLCLNASQATKIEKIFGSYAFTEGWAHYCEQMMVDEGFAGAPNPDGSPVDKVKAARFRMAQIDEALLRACRFCVSIKMHCLGMSLTEGTKFFQDNCYYEEKPARQEAVRGTFDPEYLYYTLGKLEILKLREDYRQQEGAAFSLEKFHAEMLNYGSPPLRLLREMMLRDTNSWDHTL
ncbi:MAG: hypothetical protein JWR69_4701 [Pedosphaera sp.]|nr:hypothetical protein [Pedosphaera sp.]